MDSGEVRSSKVEESIIIMSWEKYTFLYTSPSIIYLLPLSCTTHLLLNNVVAKDVNKIR